MPSIDGTLAHIRNTYCLWELYTGNVGLTKVTINGSWCLQDLCFQICGPFICKRPTKGRYMINWIMDCLTVLLFIRLVKGFTLLCLTWAILDSDGLVMYLRSRFHQRYEPTRWEGEIKRVGMNLVVIEEHQVRDLVFAQVHYLYTLLEATSAYVIVPIAKVPQTKYSSYQY